MTDQDGNYVDIYLDVKAKLGLDARDCCFETLAGVVVDDILFRN